MQTTMTNESWLANLEVYSTDWFVYCIRQGKVDSVKALKGTVRYELTCKDGSVIKIATMFGGEDEPEFTLDMTAEDFAAMMRGELNGQMAFMTGKLKFEGSLPLLMQYTELYS